MTTTGQRKKQTFTAPSLIKAIGSPILGTNVRNASISIKDIRHTRRWTSTFATLLTFDNRHARPLWKTLIGTLPVTTKPGIVHKSRVEIRSRTYPFPNPWIMLAQLSPYRQFVIKNGKNIITSESERQAANLGSAFVYNVKTTSRGMTKCTPLSVLTASSQTNSVNIHYTIALDGWSSLQLTSSLA